uniref:Uncharacterized protein n=1 Tax=Knipowitschia caucasica TaxID=637954 RepID=A0AAV2MAU8_KNICA
MPMVASLMVCHPPPSPPTPRRGGNASYPLDRFSHLTASAVVRMRMAMPVQPASPPVDYLQSLAPSPRRRRPFPSSAGSSSHGTASGLCGAKNP